MMMVSYKVKMWWQFSENLPFKLDKCFSQAVIEVYWLVCAG